jgi:hypothetical protein
MSYISPIGIRRRFKSKNVRFHRHVHGRVAVACAWPSPPPLWRGRRKSRPHHTPRLRLPRQTFCPTNTPRKIQITAFSFKISYVVPTWRRPQVIHKQVLRSLERSSVIIAVLVATKIFCFLRCQPSIDSSNELSTNLQFFPDSTSVKGTTFVIRPS